MHQLFLQIQCAHGKCSCHFFNFIVSISHVIWKRKISGLGNQKHFRLINLHSAQKTLQLFDETIILMIIYARNQNYKGNPLLSAHFSQGIHLIT